MTAVRNYLSVVIVREPRLHAVMLCVHHPTCRRSPQQCALLTVEAGARALTEGCHPQRLAPLRPLDCPIPAHASTKCPLYPKLQDIVSEDLPQTAPWHRPASPWQIARTILERSVHSASVLGRSVTPGKVAPVRPQSHHTCADAPVNGGSIGWLAATRN
jgi:hypothetical protein